MNQFFQFNEYLELGKIFNDCTAFQISIEFLDKAIKLSNYLPINQYRLVNAYELRGNSQIFLNNYQEAIIDFSKAIEINPKDSFLYFWRGFAYEYLQEYSNAVKDLKISLQLNPNIGLTKSLLNHIESNGFQ